MMMMKRELEVPDNIAVSFFKSYVGGVSISNVYQARCPVCGDSQTNKHKRRMYLLKKGRVWFVYCHNCEYSRSLLNFVKEFFPIHYDNLINQSVNDFLFVNMQLTKKDKDIEIRKLITRVSKKINSNLNEKTPVEKYIEENSVPLQENCGNNDIQAYVDEQIKLLKDRRLSDNFISKLYYAYSGHFKDRVIIPFLDRDNHIYYFQAKGTKEYHKANKYINWKDENETEYKEKPEYNECFVDNNKTVYIVEGLLDSLFLDNAVATLGATLSTTKIKKLKTKYPNHVWVMDNDYVGKNKTEKLLKMDENCVIFPRKYKKIKDLNDLAILLKKDNLTEIVKNFSYNSIEGIIQIGELK